MSKSKHKLSGYAIKGDGTQETAERIRKVFEADGWDCVNWSFMEVSGNSAYYGDAIDHKIYYYYSDKPLIPLTEAERIVFGDELKVGMKVVFTDEAKEKGIISDASYIDEIHYLNNTTDMSGKRHVKLKIDKRVLSQRWLRRATITDFLRTLPEDIAERALRQVDEEYEFYGKYPDALTNAVASFADWEKTEEGYKFWLQVGQGNYDRASAILAEKDRVGKWWKGQNDSMCRCTRTDEKGNLYGYGVSQFGEWYDDDECIAIASSDVKGLTPATPEEVEAMLVKEAKKRGFGDGVEFKPLAGISRGEKNAFPINGGVTFDFYSEINQFCIRAGSVVYTIFHNGKWAEIITPATEKPKYNVGDWVHWSGSDPLTAQIKGKCPEFDDSWDLGVDSHNSCSEKNLRHATPEEIASVTGKTEPKSGKQWMMIPTKDDECIVVWIEAGGLKYKFEKAVEIDGCTTVQIDTNEPQPTDKFPRMMWVSADHKYWFTVDVHAYIHSLRKWVTGCGNFTHAQDTHPVTGEPAVKKDVVEMIREVVENDFTTDFYKVNEIKEIIKNEK